MRSRPSASAGQRRTGTGGRPADLLSRGADVMAAMTDGRYPTALTAPSQQDPQDKSVLNLQTRRAFAKYVVDQAAKRGVPIDPSAVIRALTGRRRNRERRRVERMAMQPPPVLMRSRPDASRERCLT